CTAAPCSGETLTGGKQEKEAADERDSSNDGRYRHVLLLRRGRLERAHVEDGLLPVVADPAIDQREDSKRHQYEAKNLHVHASLLDEAALGALRPRLDSKCSQRLLAIRSE